MVCQSPGYKIRGIMVCQSPGYKIRGIIIMVCQSPGYNGLWFARVRGIKSGV